MTMEDNFSVLGLLTANDKKKDMLSSYMLQQY
jgi:hypothetical protein